jgi:PAS domain S-box-containing protein
MVAGPDLFIGLFNNLAIFIVLIACYGYLNSHLYKTPLLLRQTIMGLCFGAVSIICMHVRLQVAEGVIVDQRNTIVTLSGAFGGPLAALVCALFSGAYRAYLGGSGVLAGLIGISLSTFCGICIHKLRPHIDTGLKAVLVAAAATAVILPGFLFVGDWRAGWELMKAMVLPYGLAIFFGLLFIGLLLAHEERRYIAENEHRKSEKRFRELFENLLDIVYQTDTEGRITLISPASKKVTGYTPNELLGKKIGDYYLDFARREVFMSQLLSAGRLENFEAQLVRKDGSHVWVSTNARKLTDDKGAFVGVEGITRDISLLKKAEGDKAKLADQLRQSQKMQAVGTLASGVAHDFNNLLQAISGYVELIKFEAKVPSITDSHVSQILGTVDRAAELVRRLMVFSRKSEVKSRTLDLNQEINQAVQLLSRIIPKMVRIETDLAQDLWQVPGDSTQIEQVLMNLGSNARDAMPQGGNLVITIRNFVMDESFVAFHLDAQPGNYVHLAVSDTGVGMDKETSQRIFEPFFTTKALGEGTGLGLSTVYGIVTGMGGYISCYSELGQGTVFNLYLPAQSESGQEVRPAGQTPLIARLGGTGRILLVDDEPAIQRSVSRMLADVGYQVEIAASGEEALAFYQAEPQRVDLVIMDLGMPGMGGVRALKEILALDPMAKVIIASGYSDHERLDNVKDSGAAAYIVKPFKTAELLWAIHQLLDQPSA